MQEPLSENLDSTPTPEEAVVTAPEDVLEPQTADISTTGEADASTHDAPVAPDETSEPAQAEAEAAPEPVVEAPKVAVVRKPMIGVHFPSSSKMFCFTDNGLMLKTGEMVIVEGELGITVGRVAKAPYEPEELEREPKPVLRRATKEDLRQHAENESYCLEARAFCNERIASRGLPMKLLLAEVTLDRKRLLFYFISESRIDFRELVKDLASKYRTRIELRQIGVRDAAKMVGGIGVCGLEYCCRTFLKGFAPISIKMAKQQDLVLNTAKLSGGCGRLLCCLQYEYDEDAVRAKKRAKNAGPQIPMTEEIPAQGSKPAQPARPLRTRPPKPAPVEGAEPELTYHTDFEYEPQFTTPQEPDVVAPSQTAPTATTAGEQEERQRRRRRRGKRKPGAEQGAAQQTPQGAQQPAGAGERRDRPQESRPPRPQRPPMPPRPPRTEQAQSAGDVQQRPSGGERPAGQTGEATGGDTEAQRARRRRRWRNKPKGGPSQ